MLVFGHLQSLLEIAHAHGKDKRAALELIKEYGAYVALPDAIRGIVPKGLRSVSHFSTERKTGETSWIQFPVGEDLKNITPLVGNKSSIHYFPEGLEPAPSDGKMGVSEFLARNKGVKQDPRLTAVYAHLLQDKDGDAYTEVADPYYGEKSGIVEIYGTKAHDSITKFHSTGKEGSAQDFRNFINASSSLAMREVWQNTKKLYPNISMEEILNAFYESCAKHYPTSLAEEQATFTEPDEKNKTVMTTDNEKIIDEIKDELCDPIKIGALESHKQVNKFVGGLTKNIKNITKIDGTDKIK